MAPQLRIGDTPGMARRAHSRDRRRLAGLGTAAALAWAGAAGAQSRHEDARPPERPPGFEPVDVEQEVQERQAERRQELESQAEVDMRYRYASPERDLRARYGSATWNLYEPYH